MKKFPLVFVGTLSASLLLGCSESDSKNVAGGVSEETNSVAGILSDKDGKPLGGVAVLARHVAIDTLQFEDTTSAEGEFSFPIVRQGIYGVSANDGSVAYYSAFKYAGEKMNIDATMRPVSKVSAGVSLDEDAELKDIEVCIPGSRWCSKTDSLGQFTLSRIPVGTYNIEVHSPDPVRYLDAQFALDLREDGFSLQGPLQSAAFQSEVEPNVNFVTDGVSSKDSKPVITLPLSVEYGIVSWWPMDYIAVVDGDTVTTDARGRIGSTRLYGGVELGQGAMGKSLRFRNAKQFGVIEDDRGSLDSLEELTLEAFVNVHSVGKGNFQKNIMGKLGFGEDRKDVFSLALVNGECGVEKPTLGFFMADGTGEEFSCDNAVLSSAGLVENEWYFVVVTWKNGTLKLYQSGELVGSSDIGVKMLQQSDEPVFFGKEDLDFELDDVRLGAKAITSADVLYRYYQKNGGKL